jgi:hypothetical protein
MVPVFVKADDSPEKSYEKRICIIASQLSDIRLLTGEKTNHSILGYVDLNPMTFHATERRKSWGGAMAHGKGQ